jgi:hypothetical protein
MTGFQIAIYSQIRMPATLSFAAGRLRISEVNKSNLDFPVLKK